MGTYPLTHFLLNVIGTVLQMQLPKGVVSAEPSLLSCECVMGTYLLTHAAKMCQRIRPRDTLTIREL